MRSSDGMTNDTLFGGRVVLAQPRKGYRVNVDAILLAAFAARALPLDPRAASAPKPPRTARAAFDLGSGVGAVGLTLLHLEAATRVSMIEVDASLATLARQNADANGWSDRVDVVNTDVSALVRKRPPTEAAIADLVVCNPPYVAPGRGREPRESVSRARRGDIAGFLDAARHLLGRRGRACFVYPAVEATTLLGALRARGLEAKRLRAVHGKPADPARVVLVECCAGRPGGLSVEPPLVETDGSGKRTESVARLLGG